MESMGLNELLKVFEGKRVIITGDTGFKGSWLSLWLHELGADVVGFALPPKHNDDHFNLLGLNKIIHHVDGDIRNLNELEKVFKEYQPTFLFHLAAQALVRFSYEEPKLTLNTNIGGSVNVLEIVRSTPSLRSVIYVTSDKCYKNKEWFWGYRENDELGGRDPYSASKAAAEIVFSAYMDSFLRTQDSLGVASVRAGNVIGGGDWSEDRIVPDCIRCLKEDQPIFLRKPNSTRPWQHVLEPLSGYLHTAAKLYKESKRFSGTWNFGPNDDSIHTVKELAEKIMNCWGGGKIEVVESENHPYEANLLHLNCDKAHQILGWYPRWDYNRAVTETVKWYKEVIAGSPALDVTRQQIADYMEG